MAESIYGFIRNSISRRPDRAGGRASSRPTWRRCSASSSVTNIFGIIPFFQISPNSHIAFPAVLAIISYVLYIYVGIRKHGFVRYLKKRLIPPGVPW